MLCLQWADSVWVQWVPVCGQTLVVKNPYFGIVDALILSNRSLFNLIYPECDERKWLQQVEIRAVNQFPADAQPCVLKNISCNDSALFTAWLGKARLFLITLHLKPQGRFPSSSGNCLWNMFASYVLKLFLSWKPFLYFITNYARSKCWLSKVWP